MIRWHYQSKQYTGIWGTLHAHLKWLWHFPAWSTLVMVAFIVTIGAITMTAIFYGVSRDWKAQAWCAAQGYPGWRSLYASGVHCIDKDGRLVVPFHRGNNP